MSKPILTRRVTSPILMTVLICEILASPIGDTHPRVGAVLVMVILGSVLLAASVVGNRRIVSRVGVPLSILWAVARLLKGTHDDETFYDFLPHLVGLAVSLTLLWALFDHIRTTPEVTSSVIAESVMIYLIIAIAFSEVYWVLNEIVPHAFNQTISKSDNTTMMYFSLITLTSVGYGGIVPINPYVRLIAGFESMGGIFYIAVVVSRLVSSYRLRAEAARTKRAA